MLLAVIETSSRCVSVCVSVCDCITDGRSPLQEVDLERRRERQNLAAAEDKHRPRSPH